MMRTILQLRYFLPAMVGGILLYAGTATGGALVYDSRATSTASKIPEVATTTVANVEPIIPVFVVTHIAPPQQVRAAYMTSCIASTPKLRATLTKLVEKTELNAIIIDIKDYTGMISFDVEDPRFTLNSKGCHIPDIKEYIAELHKKKIYVIGRVTVMQDSVYPKAHPDAAVKRKSDGGIWKDKKGLMFIDPGASDYWEYMVALGKASYAVGFDEINYDYIRFPSDGDMSNIKFTHTGTTSKPVMMKKFYSYLGGAMHKAGIPISADLFGMTTTNTDDLNIGQILEDALLHFDYVAPMVYPSHYPPGFNGWKDPNAVPYEIIKFAMSRAVKRADELEKKISGYKSVIIGADGATSTAPAFVPKGIYSKKLRPWIQDFDYGKVYTEADVRAQKKAVYDSGLNSWMSWDPSNKYTPSAYNSAETSLPTATSTGA